MPLTSTTKTSATESVKLARSSSNLPPNNDQRKPSITPTIGFNPYQNRKRSGTSALLKNTGERYMPNCTRNGTTKRKSRYFTFSAVIHSPAPSEVAKAITTNSGS